MSKQSPARMLHGLTLQGWQIGPIMERVDGQTGGHFSVLYPVTHETTGQHGFLKAVDLIKDLANPAKLSEKLANYHYEERILKICKDLDLEGVVVALASGIHQTTFNGIDVAVPYLVFEKADGDLRTHKRAQELNYEWRLRVFHSACVSMMHLHRAEIAHQDIKPSNILIFEELRAKIGDLGHATKRGMPSNYEQNDHTGDKNYVPIEILYRHYNEGNWIRRRFGADMFMMGCLLTYLVADASLLTLVFKKLDKKFWPESWNPSGRSYDDVRPHIEMVFDEVIADIRQTLPPAIAADVCHLILSLAHPNCHRRGRPFLFGEKWESIKLTEPEAYLREQYSFEYFVSRVDVVAKKARAGEGLDKQPFWKFYKKESGL